MQGDSLILASRSPQRRAILDQLGVSFEVRPADVDERTHGPAEQVVLENALHKARAVAAEVGSERLVLGVDTTVSLHGRLFGKPGDREEARAHLTQLAGREHVVWSGLAVIERGNERTATASTTVCFRRLDDETIDWYLDSGEWRERAGAYAIQGRGAALVEAIHGDYWNVVGLSVTSLLELAPQLLRRD